MNKIELNGVEYESVSALARAVGIPHGTIRARIRMGWSLEDACSRPVKTRNRVPVFCNGVEYGSIGLLAEAVGISVHTLRGRMRKRGMTLEEAVAEGPGRARKPKKCSGCGETDQAKFRATRTKCRACELRRDRLKHYGPDVVAILESHDGRCDICRKDLKPGRGTHVDHCHATGAIRGVLCGNCNRGIGMFQDRPELLLSAAEYLRS